MVGDAIKLGNGRGDTVNADTGSFDTITLGNGAGDVVNAKGMAPFGGNNTITLGNGNHDVVNAQNSIGDSIAVGNGNDTIHAGQNTTMTVGTGHDSFVFEQTRPGSIGTATVTGFEPHKDSFTFSDRGLHLSLRVLNTAANFCPSAELGSTSSNPSTILKYSGSICCAMASASATNALIDLASFPSSVFSICCCSLPISQ